MKLYCTALALLLYKSTILAQPMPILPAEKHTPHINTVFNRVVNGNMYLFYKKLQALKKSDSGLVSIVHIGDSHIQPDFLSSVVRSNLQAFFGNAGRGIVFPYQLGKSNAPVDIASTSNINWIYNRIAHPEIPVECGIAGFCIKSNRPQAQINFSLKDNSFGPQYFNHIKLFIDSAAATTWMFETNDSTTLPVILRNTDTLQTSCKNILLQNAANQFTLTSHSTGNTQSFYGAMLQNGKPGVLLHTIGVNGARYEHFNNTPLLWQQLPELKADLVIVSLGTNEAQAAALDESAFLNQVKIFIEKIKTAFPGTAIIITTPQDSYKGKRSNPVMRSVSLALASFCQQQNIGLWDLYKITNGYGSARYWLAKGLLNKDRVHFTQAGYTIQGKLLYQALAQGYNNYIKTASEF
jgi:lysophospholipase L1-like esterase